MTKENVYTYLGDNGILFTPIHLEGIPSIRKIRLTADEGKALTKDSVNYVKMITVLESDVPNWIEVEAPGQDDLK